MKKFKKWENVSRARDSQSAIIAYSDRYPPYIDLRDVFVFSSKLIHDVRYECKTEKKARKRKRKRAPQERLKKQGTQAVATLIT